MRIEERQLEQMKRHLEWVNAEGGIERPQWLSTFFKAEQHKRLRWLGDHVYPPTLEVGCNWGFVTAYVGGQAGVDTSEASIALAEALEPEKDWQVADARSLPFPDNSFVTVLLAEVLEHLPYADVPKAIAEAKRVASWQVLVTIPNGDRDGYESNCFRHQWLATREELRKLFPGEKLYHVGPFYCLQVLK